MTRLHSLLWIAALGLSGALQDVYAKCSAEARTGASALRQQAVSEPDVEQAIYLLRSSSQLCEDYNTWIALGRREAERDNPDYAADYFYRARNMYQPDEHGLMSMGKIRRLAVSNVLLASALNDSERYADALDALETAKRYIAVYANDIPERVLSLQASIDDNMSAAPASTLTRSMSIQRAGSTRGVGIRVKPQEVSDEFIGEDADLLREENLTDVLSDPPISIASTASESTDIPGQNPLNQEQEQEQEREQTLASAGTDTPSASDTASEASTPGQATPATRLNIQVLFDFDSDQISGNGNQQVGRLADALSSLSLPGDTLVQIIGHTDINGSAEYNASLSERRARTVVTEISRLVPDLQLVAVGRGESEPRYPGTTREDHRRNRRVEIVIN